MTALAATVVVALLVVVALARLISIVAAVIEYLADRPARQPRRAFLLTQDSGLAGRR